MEFVENYGLSHRYVIVGKRAATYLLTTVVKFSEKKTIDRRTRNSYLEKHTKIMVCRQKGFALVDP